MRYIALGPTTRDPGIWFPTALPVDSLDRNLNRCPDDPGRRDLNGRHSTRRNGESAEVLGAVGDPGAADANHRAIRPQPPRGGHAGS
jgi:hypothetical protein